MDKEKIFKIKYATQTAILWLYLYAVSAAMVLSFSLNFSSIWKFFLFSIPQFLFVAYSIHKLSKGLVPSQQLNRDIRYLFISSIILVFAVLLGQVVSFSPYLYIPEWSYEVYPIKAGFNQPYAVAAFVVLAMILFSFAWYMSKKSGVKKFDGVEMAFSVVILLIASIPSVFALHKSHQAAMVELHKFENMVGLNPVEMNKAAAAMSVLSNSEFLKQFGISKEEFFDKQMLLFEKIGVKIIKNRDVEI